MVTNVMWTRFAAQNHEESQAKMPSIEVGAA